MSDFKYIAVNSLKVGNLIDIEGLPCKITSLDHSKPGKHGAAKIRIVAVDVFTDKKCNALYSGGDEVKSPIVDRGNAQVVADMGESYQIMDLQSYETFSSPKPKEAEILSKITNGSEIEYLRDDDKVRIIRVK